jgi:hypothetical protein
MASSSTRLPARVSDVDVVDADGLGARAAEVAARQRSPQTRRTYAAVYRSLLGFLGEHAAVEDLTPEAVRAYRDALELADRTPATIAKHGCDGVGECCSPRRCSAGAQLRVMVVFSSHRMTGIPHPGSA